MFITKKHLSRREVLRGVGVTLALPFLDSMVPAQTPLRNTVAAPKTRFCGIEMVHGAAGSTVEGQAKHYWSPIKEGRDFDTTLSLASLEPYKDYLTIVTDTDLNNAMSLTVKEDGADHTRSSGVSDRRSSEDDGRGGYSLWSLDRSDLRAKVWAGHPSAVDAALHRRCGLFVGRLWVRLQLRIREHDFLGFPCRPAPHGARSAGCFRAAFRRGRDSGRASCPQGRGSKHSRHHRSRRESLAKRSLADRVRLDGYLTDVREIERRIQRVEKYNASGEARSLPDAPIGVPDSFADHVKLMFDLQALAFMTEITRVSAFKMGRDVSARIYPESGVKVPFHAASHHSELSKSIAEFAKLNAYHVSTVAYFAEKLKNTPDGDGNLLDHTLIMYGSPMGDSNVHEHKKLPVFLLGHAGGQLKGNVHLKCPRGTPMANLLLTTLRKLGVSDVKKIGDSTGELAI